MRKREGEERRNIDDTEFQRNNEESTVQAIEDMEKLS